MDFERHCTEIVTQTELLTTGIKGVDLGSPVPSCPGWHLGNLVRHVGGGHRWAEEIVRTRATGFIPDDQVRKLDGTDELPATWLLDGATRLADTLRLAGLDVQIWAPPPFTGTAFWARRFAFETLVHRADATLAARAEIDEWMELDALPQHFDRDPGKRSLLGPGRTLAFVAPEASWVIDLTGDVIVSGQASSAAAVTVRGSLADLLLVIYRRKGVQDVQVSGDHELLDFWLTQVGFG
jgi:uncharacterized protein (TIGR03083 family)